MEYKLSGYQPEAFFRYFEEISAIPRGSGNEEGISKYLMQFAKDKGLTAWSDEIFNVVIVKPASAGKENAPSVILQGHTDIVCEKNADTVHDFLTDGIKLIQEGNILRADGTTLGADNGVAVAMMLTVLADDTLVHPDLYCIFTVQEETGLTGAKELDGSKIPARLLINLDSGGLGHATVSCAGGMRVRMHKACGSTPCDQPALAVRVRGLQGGHSGTEIGKGLGNSNKVMGRLLHEVRLEIPSLALSSIGGGSKDNAIPRECDAVCVFENEADLAKAEAILRKAETDIKDELKEVDPDFHLVIEAVKAETKMDKAMSDALITLLVVAPNGVRDRNEKAGGFVVRSLNMGVIRMENDTVTVVFAPRSSVASLQDQTAKELTLLAESFGFTVDIGEAYPGWAYNPESPLRRLFEETWKEQTGEDFVCSAIHAGLECGLFCEKFPGLDAIAVGANAYGGHTPDETLDMASVEPIYKQLLAVLARI